MVRHEEGLSSEDSTGAGCPRTSSSNASITRRRYLVVGAAFTVVGGCVGDEDDVDAVDSDTDDHATDGDTDDHAADDTADDGAPPADDNNANGDADDSVADSSDDGEEEPAETLDVREDFESYILDMEITHEGPDGEWTQGLYRETDIANDRLYQIFEMVADEGESEAFEHYIVDGEAYQILPDGTCTSSDEATIMIHAENPGGFDRPHPDQLDESDENISYGDTTSVAWVDEPVHVWELDLEPTFEAIEGAMRIYIGVESGYFVGYEGRYTTGAHDDPAEITIEYRRHGFNQDFEIEIPDECTDG